MRQIQDAALITAIKTPYLENGEFDLDSYDQMVERQIKGGVQGLIVGGTTGEGHLMNWDEHIMLIAHTVNRFSNDLVIIGNTGSNNTRESYKATQQGFAVGMDYALQINPYYGKTSEEGLLSHYNRVLELGPIIVYNVPTRTNQDIPTAIIEELSAHENMIGVKECMGRERISHYEKQGIMCWSGNDDQSHDSKHIDNAHGVISVTSNLLPGTMRKLMDSPNEELNNRLQKLFKWLFCLPSPIPLNTILAMMGLVKPVFRLPYVPASQEIRTQGKKILEELGLDEIPEVLLDLKDSDFIIV